MKQREQKKMITISIYKSIILFSRLLSYHKVNSIILIVITHYVNDIQYSGFATHLASLAYQQIRSISARYSLRSFNSSAHLASRLYYCPALRASPFFARFYELVGCSTPSRIKNNIPVIDDIFKTVIVFKYNNIDLHWKRHQSVHWSVKICVTYNGLSFSVKKTSDRCVIKNSYIFSISDRGLQN